MNAAMIEDQRVRSVEPMRSARRRTVRRSMHGGKPTSWIGPVTWAVALAVFVIAAGTLPTARDSFPPRAASAILVTVAPTDTLWSIAARHRSRGASTAETVDAIVDANRLARRTVIAGTTLRVPTPGVSEAALARSAETVATR